MIVHCCSGTTRANQQLVTLSGFVISIPWCCSVCLPESSFWILRKVIVYIAFFSWGPRFSTDHQFLVIFPICLCSYIFCFHNLFVLVSFLFSCANEAFLSCSRFTIDCNQVKLASSSFSVCWFSYCICITLLQLIPFRCFCLHLHVHL